MKTERELLATQVLIIGGGATGTGLARDLALRGVRCLLVEQDDICTGASGANHGLLHSGGRYVSNDQNSARECRVEGDLLKRLAGHCVEDTGGLFVAVQGDDEGYVADFPGYCAQCGISCRPVGLEVARELEPALSDTLIAAYEVPDATVDPFKLALENMAHARALGSSLLTHHRVVEFRLRGRRIAQTLLVDTRTGQQTLVEADEVVNASGAWAGEVARLAGVQFGVIYSKGTLLITQRRMSNRVINRLRPPSSADIAVPGGTVSIIGTTSVRIDSLDEIAPTYAEVDLIMDDATAMLPDLAEARIMRAYAGVRPLVSRGAAGDDRAVSRGLALMDHAEDGVDNFVTIAGGKLTTYRDMAEKTADVVCAHLGVTAPCVTAVEPLPRNAPWTVPGASAHAWVRDPAERDPLLCECEMVPRSAVEHIVSDILVKNLSPSLREIGQRSRVGKGSCQGAFCSLRVLGHLYESGRLDTERGLDNLREFLDERWKGERTIFWGAQLKQAELLEAIHCGFLGLEQD
jgi:glycerol-3-phosphate dehydrogenase